MLWRNGKKHTIQYFVSIGAGINQIPLIMAAKKLGLNVIGVDGNATAPGFMHCDLKIQESIENYHEIYTKLQELLIDGDISCIMTKSYGKAIKTTSYLTDTFKLPFLPFSISDHFIDKKLMKADFIAHGILTPALYTINQNMKPERFNAEDYPLIVKPTIGHAKMGINLISTSDELNNHLRSTPHRGHLCYEKFIRGNEFIAAGIIHNRRYHCICISDKETTPLPHFVDQCHSAPSRYEHLAPSIGRIGQKVADAFSITTAPLIMEFVADATDNLYLIEAVPEFGGEFIPDILVPEFCGYDIITETIKAQTAHPDFNPLVKKKKNRDAVVVQYINATEAGKLASCNPKGPQNIKDVIFSRIFKEIGSEVRTPENNHDRIGVIVARGKTVADARAVAQSAIASLNIRIK